MSTTARLVVASAVLAAALGTGAIAGPTAASASTAPPNAVLAAPANVEPPEPSPEPGAEPEPPAQEEEAEPSPAPSPEPPLEPSPEPGPEPTPPPEDDGDGEQSAPGEAGEECGRFDIECKVIEAFRGWIAGVVGDFLNTQLMATSVSLMLVTPPTSGIQSVWSTALAVVNVGFVLVVTAAGVLLMGYQTVQTSAGAKEILPRLVLAFIAANASWFVTQQLGRIGNGISAAVLGETADPDNVTNTFERFLAEPVLEGLITVQLMLMSSVAGIIFAFTVIIRVMLWILLTAAAPLALAAHALPQTEGLARLWWRAIGALLIMQIAQALTLRTIMTLFLERESLDAFDPLGMAGSIIDLGVLVACLYVLIRIPFWAGKRVFNYQNSPLVKGAKLAASLLVFKGLGLGKALAGQKAQKVARTARTAQRVPQPKAAPAPGPSRRPRFHQPELPGVWPRVPRGHQHPLPGIDRQIDPAAQRRLRQRRRWVQPPLPAGESNRPPWHRQASLPGMEGLPRGRQDPLPNLKPAPRARQEALFAPPPARHRPSPRRDTQRPAPTQPRPPQPPPHPSGTPSPPNPAPQPPSGLQRRAVRPTPRHDRYRNQRRRRQ